MNETLLPGRWRIGPTLRELLMLVTSGAAQIDKRSNAGVKHTDNNNILKTTCTSIDCLNVYVAVHVYRLVSM